MRMVPAPPATEPAAPARGVAIALPRTAPRLSPAERRALIGLAIAASFWAAGFVIGKALVGAVPPLIVASWRYAVASAVLLPVVLLGLDRHDPATHASQSPPISRSGAVGLLALMTVTSGVLYPWSFLMALQHTSATNTSLLIALNPAFTILAAPLIGERLTRRTLGALAIALFGAVLVITRGDLAATWQGGLNRGDLLALLSAALWATFNLASRPVVGHFSPSATNLTVYGLGGIALFALSAADHPLDRLLGMTPWAIAGIAAMAVLSSVVAGQLFLVGVRTLGVSRTVVFIYLVPVLTAGMSILLLGERPLFSQLLGGAAVLLGVSRMTRA